MIARPMTSSRAVVVVLLLHVAVSLADAQAADPNGALKVADVLSVREFLDRGQVDLSPDGRHVAFALRDPIRVASMQRGRRGYFSTSGVPVSLEGSAIHVTEVLPSKTRNITQPVRNSKRIPNWWTD